MRTSLLLGAIVAGSISIPMAWGQCYLEDSTSTCVVCWKTTSRKITTMSECPKGAISLEWTKPLPQKLLADTDNPTSYKFKVDLSMFNVTAVSAKGKLWDIPHSNLHSCPSDKGACTPFVGNTPGLSTHTPSSLGNLSVDGVYVSEIFDANVKLSADRYTIIAHNRFYVPDPEQSDEQECYPNCKIKYDAAAGVLKEVVEAAGAPSTDAYVGTGIVGCVMLGIALAAAWGARSGKLNIDAIMKSLFRDEVLLPAETMCIVGDCITFTMTFFSEIMEDNQLKEVIPPGAFFLCTGWISSICVFCHNCFQIWYLIKLKRQDPALMKEICKKLSISDEDAAIYLGGKKGNRRDSTIIEQNLLEQWGLNKLARKRQIHLLTMFFEEGPFAALSAYVLVKATSVEVIVVVAFGLATLQLGGKMAAVSSYADHLTKQRELEISIHRAIAEDEGMIEKFDSVAYCSEKSMRLSTLASSMETGSGGGGGSLWSQGMVGSTGVVGYGQKHGLTPEKASSPRLGPDSTGVVGDGKPLPAPDPASNLRFADSADIAWKLQDVDSSLTVSEMVNPPFMPNSENHTGFLGSDVCGIAKP